MRVQDVMTRSVISVRPDTQLREVARLLDEHRISGVLVVDEQGALLGVVSEADFLVEAQGGAAVLRRSPIARLFGRAGDAGAPGDRHFASTARELMTSPVITIGPAELIADAAAVMTRERINRLPVVEDGRLVGIVTRADLVRSYVRSDEQLAEGHPRGRPRPDPVAGSEGVRGHRRRWDRDDPRQRRSAVVGGDDRAHRGARAGVRDVVADVRWTIDDAEIRNPTPGPEFPFSPE